MKQLRKILAIGLSILFFLGVGFCQFFSSWLSGSQNNDSIETNTGLIHYGKYSCDVCQGEFPLPLLTIYAWFLFLVIFLFDCIFLVILIKKTKVKIEGMNSDINKNLDALVITENLRKDIKIYKILLILSVFMVLFQLFFLIQFNIYSIIPGSYFYLHSIWKLITLVLYILFFIVVLFLKQKKTRSYLILIVINLLMIPNFFHNHYYINHIFGFYGEIPTYECNCRYYGGSVLYDDTLMDGKPVIYLYPTKETEVSVKLDYDGELFVSYPEYDETIGGWEVLAKPDGTLIDRDGKEYSYLFWEGLYDEDWDLLRGFVVKGKDTVEFLQETLSKMGLTPREFNEFIVYRYPKMKDNKYNLIYFAGSDYTDRARLTVNPLPDSMLRVFMVYKPLEEFIEIPPQEIKSFERTGFTVVEWGGSEIR